MKIIKVSFSEESIQQLDAEAKALDMPRAELIRRKVAASTAQDTNTFSPADYNKLVAKAQKRMGGALCRSQVEQVVAYVFRCLSE